MEKLELGDRKAEDHTASNNLGSQVTLDQKQYNNHEGTFPNPSGSIPSYFQNKNYHVEDDDNDDESSVVSSILSFTKRAALANTNVLPDALSLDTLGTPRKNHTFSYVKYKGTENNYKIMLNNIRHFNVVFWILVYANVMITCTFLSIIYSLVVETWNVFSFSTIVNYLLITLIVEIILTIMMTLVTVLRVLKLRCESRRTIHQITSVLHFLHYPAILTVVGTNLYLSLSTLQRNMQNELDVSMSQGITELFSSTQMKHRCCGINSFTDWNPNTVSEWISYPLSCCPDHRSKSDGKCYKSEVWEAGCYDVESRIMSWHAGWVLGLIALGFVINISMILQVNRLFNYLKIFSDDKNENNPVLHVQLGRP